MQMVNELEDIDLLNRLIWFLEQQNGSVKWSELPQSHRNSIERAEKEIEAGVYYSHEEAMDRIVRK